MKISIITVVRNAKELFIQTFESVRNQSYQNIEYVVVDGNSTDGTKEFIQENQNAISTWISEKDESLYDAMNKGLQLATGDFVWFLHAGDTIPNADTLERLTSQIGNSFQNLNFIDFIYGEVKIKHHDGSFSDYHKKAPSEIELMQKGWKNFLEGMIICHQAMLVRREIAPLYNLKFRLAGDIDWSIRLFKNIEERTQQPNEIRTKRIPLVIAYFLEGGISTSQKKKSLLERFKIFQKHTGTFAALWQHFILLKKSWFS